MAIESAADRAIFLDAAEFGAAVEYTIAATGEIIAIDALWIERPLAAGFADADEDAIASTLLLRADDIAAPVEDDLVERLSDGQRMRVVPPIAPDGTGMIRVALEIYAPVVPPGYVPTYYILGF